MVDNVITMIYNIIIKGDDMMNKLAQELKAKRHLDGISMEKCARKLNLATMTVARIERGDAVGPKALKKLSRYLGKPIEELKLLSEEL